LKYIIKLFTFIILIVVSFYIFILSIDPYDKYGFNYFNLTTKAVNSYRDNKFHQIDNTIEKYDLFILGSSRVQAFDPDIIEKDTGLKTFNYGVNNSKPEDLLAITRHIIEKQTPKIIFLQLDFYNLNKHIPMDGRLKVSPLREYLDNTVKAKIDNKNFYYFEQNYTTLTSLKDAIKLLYKNKLGTVEITHKKNGMKIGYEPREKPNLAEGYFKNEYKNYEFGKNRIEYFNQLKSLCDKNNIKLIVSISPMNEEHFLKLVNDKHLYKVLFDFKRKVVEIFDEVYDFNNFGAFEYQYPYWNDSVHPSVELPKIMSKILFNSKSIDNNFGIKLNKDNIDEYLKQLKQQIKDYDLKEALPRECKINN
jgi:hypothetical protein